MDFPVFSDAHAQAIWNLYKNTIESVYSYSGPSRNLKYRFIKFGIGLSHRQSSKSHGGELQMYPK